MDKPKLELVPNPKITKEESDPDIRPTQLSVWWMTPETFHKMGHLATPQNERLQAMSLAGKDPDPQQLDAVESYIEQGGA